MSTYFPYSHIIQSICNNIYQHINRHAYFGEWSVCDTEQPESQNCTIAISEIYY